MKIDYEKEVYKWALVRALSYLHKTGTGKENWDHMKADIQWSCWHHRNNPVFVEQLNRILAMMDDVEENGISRPRDMSLEVWL